MTKRILLLLGGALTAFAQQPEIRGVVLELPYNTPVAGAEVYVSGAPSVLTDVSGSFRVAMALKPHTSQLVSVTKEGYVQVPGKTPGSYGGRDAVLAESAQSVVLHVIRTSGVRGRLVDADTGDPIARLSVLVQAVDYRRGQRITGDPKESKTDADGRFSFSELFPSEFLVSIRSKVTGSDRFTTEFSKEEVKTIDQDYGDAYWPATSDYDSATPVKLDPGAPLDLGTWKVRKRPLFRVHISISTTNCPPKETVLVRPYTPYKNVGGFVSIGGGQARCGGEFLLTHYSPGKYSIDLSANVVRTTASIVMPIEIRDSNVEVEATLQPSGDLQARIVALEGASVRTENLLLGIASVNGFTNSGLMPKPDAEGRVRFPDVTVGKKSIDILPFGNVQPFYVKEVRFNGSPIQGGIFDWAGAGTIEVIVDDKPAMLRGSVTDRDKPVSGTDIVVVRWPAYFEDMFRSVLHSATNNEGKFGLGGLAPGEYRVFALPNDTKDKLNEPRVLERMLQNAISVKLERGGTGNIDLQLSNPTR